MFFSCLREVLIRSPIYNIIFNNLYTITNMPIARFGSKLISEKKFEKYMELLKNNFNNDALNNVLWQSNITKSQQEKLDTILENEMLLHILVMNVEALSTEKGVNFARKFINSHKTLMAIDESTTIKTPTAQRTKNIILLGKQAKYKRIIPGLFSITILT